MAMRHVGVGNFIRGDPVLAFGRTWKCDNGSLVASHTCYFVAWREAVKFRHWMPLLWE